MTPNRPPRWRGYIFPVAFYALAYLAKDSVGGLVCAALATWMLLELRKDHAFEDKLAEEQARYAADAKRAAMAKAWKAEERKRERREVREEKAAEKARAGEAARLAAEAPKPAVEDESDYPHMHGRSGPPAPKRANAPKLAKAPKPIIPTAGDEDPYTATRRFEVHYCEPAMGHRMHWMVKVGRVPGWFVFVYNFDVLRTLGPFETREAAEDAGAASLAA